MSSSLNAKLSRSLWGYLGSMEHILYYNKKSLKYLLNKNEFEILSIKNKSHSGTCLQNVYRLFYNYFYMQPIKNLLNAY